MKKKLKLKRTKKGSNSMSTEYPLSGKIESYDIIKEQEMVEKLEEEDEEKENKIK